MPCGSSRSTSSEASAASPPSSPCLPPLTVCDAVDREPDAVLHAVNDEAGVATLWWSALALGDRGARAPRGELLRGLATRQADELADAVPAGDLGALAPFVGTADDLRRDGILASDEGRYAFAHDLFADWSRLQMLLARPEAPELVRAAQLPTWHRAIRLYALRTLAERGIDAWREQWAGRRVDVGSEGCAPRAGGTACWSPAPWSFSSERSILAVARNDDGVVRSLRLVDVAQLHVAADIPLSGGAVGLAYHGSRSTACTSDLVRADIPACAVAAFNTRGEAPTTRRAQPTSETSHARPGPASRGTQGASCVLGVRLRDGPRLQHRGAPRPRRDPPARR
jgi:hypothetical protein